MKIKKQYYWLALIVLTLIYSDETMAQTPSTGLPGSAVKWENSVGTADLILTGTLETLGLTVPSATGQVAYHGAKIKIEKVLKGNAVGEITVSIIVRFEKGRVEETIPEVGKDYLFFIYTDEAKRQIVLKMLPAGASDVSAVTAAITK